jgi:hypothetical protein
VRSHLVDASKCAKNGHYLLTALIQIPSLIPPADFAAQQRSILAVPNQFPQLSLQTWISAVTMVSLSFTGQWLGASAAGHRIITAGSQSNN